MGSSPPPDTSEQVLFARMRTLYAQLNDAQHRTLKYERLSAEIHELAIAYSTLVEANRINRPAAKPFSLRSPLR